jgi:hypothetical protein
MGKSNACAGECLAIVPYIYPCGRSRPARTPKTRSAASAVPVELLNSLLPFLDAESLCTASVLSSAFSKLANDDRHWAELCRVDWGVTPDAFSPPPEPVKRFWMVCVPQRSLCFTWQRRLHSTNMHRFDLYSPTAIMRCTHQSVTAQMHHRGLHKMRTTKHAGIASASLQTMLAPVQS